MREQNTYEIKNIVTRIEVASDEIVKLVKIDDVTIEALRMIKDSVLKIGTAVSHGAEEMPSAYLPVLNRILGYLRKISLYPLSVEDYAERIKSHVENYILLQKPYDEAYESDKDKAIDSFIEHKATAARIEDLKKEMQALVEKKINGGCPVDSLEYNALVTRHNALEKQLQSEEYRLTMLQKVIHENSLIKAEVEKAATLSDMASLRTKTFNEFSVMAYQNRDKNIEEESLFSAFDQIAEEVSLQATPYKPDDRAFCKAVEETLLERLYKKDSKEYEQNILAMKNEEYSKAILELTQKKGELEKEIEKLIGQEKERAEESRKNMEELLKLTEDLSMFRNDVEGDLEKEVEYCLARTPADLAGAHLKLRTCIELYCRFEKGIDLSDKFFFKPDETATAKFATAKIDPERIEGLYQIYKHCHAFVHGDYTTDLQTPRQKQEEIALIRNNVRQLKAWGIDCYDKEKGFVQLYTMQDKQLAELLDSENVPQQDQLDKKLHYYFKRMDDLEKYMDENAISYTKRKFKDKDEVHDYLQEKNATDTNFSLESLVLKPSGRVTGKITYYDNQNQFGKIDGTVRFRLSSIEKNKKNCVEGATVSYLKDKDYKGNPIATHIEIESVGVTN